MAHRLRRERTSVTVCSVAVAVAVITYQEQVGAEKLNEVKHDEVRRPIPVFYHIFKIALKSYSHQAHRSSKDQSVWWSHDGLDRQLKEIAIFIQYWDYKKIVLTQEAVRH
ncbi:hypothetical protein M434DRAFT_35761 [Hypoxylon sp. CO27-5]|nr:hypothetical protein M434DRAFT_35761 [Hypoxylon sp. CO27-5]